MSLICQLTSEDIKQHYLPIAGESLHVCTMCIWRCELARVCVEVFKRHIYIHSVIHSNPLPLHRTGSTKFPQRPLRRRNFLLCSSAVLTLIAMFVDDTLTPLRPFFSFFHGALRPQRPYGAISTFTQLLSSELISVVQCSFTSTETTRTIRDREPGRPPRLLHSS